MFWIFLSLLPVGILGHGSLVDPPSRAAMNKYGFPDNPVDVNYNQGFCGGFSYQHSAEIGEGTVSLIIHHFHIDI